LPENARWIHRDDQKIVANFRAIGKLSLAPRKNKQREEFPRRVRGLIAGEGRESRQTGLKTGQTRGI
jgi:hypothetical protein